MTGIRFDIDGHVGWVTLDRPDKRNAFTFEMLDEWAATLNQWRDDSDVRVAVLRGAGSSFCAGVDLDEFGKHRGTPMDDKLLLVERVHKVARAVLQFDKPYLSAVRGYAVGAGMDMALMADICLASDDAVFSQAYVRVGLLPGDGGCWLLPRKVGQARALELMWTGDDVGAADAYRMGLVNHVYPVDAFDAHVREFACRLASGPPLAIRMIKRATVQSASTDFLTSLDLISSHQALVQATADSREALEARREGRLPEFVGR